MKVDLQPHISLREGDIGQIVLLPGDPARVLKIARFLKNSKKVAQNREFLTYRGSYRGVDITVTSTGIGCPSAAIAVEELANIGAKIFIRVGTCGAVKKGIEVGDLIIPTSALGDDGTTREYVSKNILVKPDPDVLRALIKSAKRLEMRYFTEKNRTRDAFYESANNFLKYKKVKGLISSEMECSIVFSVAKMRALRAGAVLAVNTVEPFDLVEENPEVVYQLSFEKKAKEGVEKAIKVVLEASALLSGKQHEYT